MCEHQLVYLKHWTTWKSMFTCFNTLKGYHKKFNWYPSRFSKSQSSLRRELTRRLSNKITTLFENFEFSLWEPDCNPKGSHWKSENRPTLVNTPKSITSSETPRPPRPPPFLLVLLPKISPKCQIMSLFFLGFLWPGMGEIQKGEDCPIFQYLAQKHWRMIRDLYFISCL